jgi:hypothetical protein
MAVASTSIDQRIDLSKRRMTVKADAAGDLKHVACHRAIIGKRAEPVPEKPGQLATSAAKTQTLGTLPSTLWHAIVQSLRRVGCSFCASVSGCSTHEHTSPRLDQVRSWCPKAQPLQVEKAFDGQKS